MAQVIGWVLIHVAGLGPILGFLGGGSTIFVACIVGWYFAPLHRADFLWAALVVAAVMASIAFGVKLGEKHIQAQWNESRAILLEQAEKARVDGVRNAARKPHRWLRKPPSDPDLRD